MKKTTISFDLHEFQNINQLSEPEQKLAQNAIDASKKAYAPYSKFQVGAAVLLDNGEIITGSNQENAAYPSGLCAERVAMFYANAQYPSSAITSIAIVAFNDEGMLPLPVAPCGACRQSLLESEMRAGKSLDVILLGSEKIYKMNSICNLLPLSFTGEELPGQ